MIRSQEALAAIFGQGRTAVRLAEMGGGTRFRLVLADTNEPVHGSALKALVKKGLATVIATDICGDPMQYGAVQ